MKVLAIKRSFYWRKEHARLVGDEWLCKETNQPIVTVGVAGSINGKLEPVRTFFCPECDSFTRMPEYGKVYMPNQLCTIEV